MLYTHTYISAIWYIFHLHKENVVKMSFEQHLRTALEINNTLRKLYPEKKLAKKTKQSNKEPDKETTKR